MKKISYRTWILLVGALYFTGVVMMNFLAVKTVGYNDFAITDCGILVSWFVFACMDIITELEGKNKAVIYFTIASILNVIFAVLSFVCILLPGTDPAMSSSFKDVFSTNWRIAIASVLGAWVGNYVNAFIMWFMKARATDKDGTVGYILRAIISSVLGQLVDNALFYILAFSPVGIPGTYELPVLLMVESVGITTGIELVVESMFVPLSAFLVKKLRGLKLREENI